MSKEGANYVVYGSYFSFNFSIFWSSVKAWKLKNKTIFVAKFFERLIVELFPIVTLKTLRDEKIKYAWDFLLMGKVHNKLE